MMLVTVFALNVFSNSATVIFVPVWARDVLHSPEALGLALGTFAAGALAGTLVFSILAKRLPRYSTFLVGALIAGAPRLFVLGISSNLALVLVVSLIGGFGLASVNPILGVAMYERIPDRLQTRVIGLCTTVAFTGVPIGALAGGWAVNALGLRHDAALGGIAVSAGEPDPAAGPARRLPRRGPGAGRAAGRTAGATDMTELAERPAELADPDCLADGESARLLTGHPWRRFVVLGDSVARARSSRSRDSARCAGPIGSPPNCARRRPGCST